MLTTACEPGSPIPVQDYTERLSRTLDEPMAEALAVDPIQLPRTRDLSFTYSEESIDLLEFLRMSDCELQMLIAERNSSLGRLAQPSQRLIYEVNFLRTGLQCVRDIQSERPDLAGRLQSVLEIKEQELPMRIWQALLGGEEFRALWSSSDSLPDAQVIEAFSQLTASVSRWLGGDYTVDATQLEQNLQQLALGGGGRMLNSWAYLDVDLQVATDVISARAGGKPLCFEGMENPQAEIFQTVVNRFFVAGVQREVAALNRVTFELMDQVQALEQQLQVVEPEAYVFWRTSRQQIVERGRQAVLDHVAAIQPLFKQCGFLPGDQAATIIRSNSMERQS